MDQYLASVVHYIKRPPPDFGDCGIRTSLIRTLVESNLKFSLKLMLVAS